MAAPKKRENEHKYLARFDLQIWERMLKYAEEKGVSANDALNDVLEIGLTVTEGKAE